MKKPVPTSIRLPLDLKRDLKRLAPLEPVPGVERRSLTWLILHVLKQWVAYKKRNPPPPAAKAGQADEEQTK